jgi:hypothetical protein
MMSQKANADRAETGETMVANRTRGNRGRVGKYYEQSSVSSICGCGCQTPGCHSELGCPEDHLNAQE